MNEDKTDEEKDEGEDEEEYGEETRFRLSTLRTGPEQEADIRVLEQEMVSRRERE
jgi:hypothetical protein